jgi:hypothetical protein
MSFLKHGEVYPCDEGTIARSCPRSSPWMSLQLGIPGGLLSSGSGRPRSFELEEMLHAVNDFLWICDGYQGHVWAAKHISVRILNTWKSDSTKKPQELSVIPAQSDNSPPALRIDARRSDCARTPSARTSI